MWRGTKVVSLEGCKTVRSLYSRSALMLCFFVSPAICIANIPVSPITDHPLQSGCHFPDSVSVEVSDQPQIWTDGKASWCVVQEHHQALLVWWVRLFIIHIRRRHVSFSILIGQNSVAEWLSG